VAEAVKSENTDSPQDLTQNASQESKAVETEQVSTPKVEETQQTTQETTESTPVSSPNSESQSSAESLTEQQV
jgi:hypothetical protein